MLGIICYSWAMYTSEFEKKVVGIKVLITLCLEIEARRRDTNKMQQYR